VVGTSDALLGVNQAAYALLRDAGNPELSFVTFPGAHDYRQQDVEQMYLWMREFDSNHASRKGQESLDVRPPRVVSSEGALFRPSSRPS